VTTLTEYIEAYGRVRWKAETFREFGWRSNRAPYRQPYIACYGAPRYLGRGRRFVPRLAYQERRPGGLLDRRQG